VRLLIVRGLETSGHHRPARLGISGFLGGCGRSPARRARVFARGPVLRMVRCLFCTEIGQFRRDGIFFPTAAPKLMARSGGTPFHFSVDFCSRTVFYGTANLTQPSNELGFDAAPHAQHPPPMFDSPSSSKRRWFPRRAKTKRFPPCSRSTRSVRKINRSTFAFLLFAMTPAVGLLCGPQHAGDQRQHRRHCDKTGAREEACSGELRAARPSPTQTVIRRDMLG